MTQVTLSPALKILLDHLDLVVDRNGNFSPPDHVIDLLVQDVAEGEGWDWIMSEYIDGDPLVAEYTGRFALTGDLDWAARLRARYMHLCRQWARAEAMGEEAEVMQAWREMHQARRDEWREDMRQSGAW